MAFQEHPKVRLPRVAPGDEGEDITHPNHGRDPPPCSVNRVASFPVSCRRDQLGGLAWLVSLSAVRASRGVAADIGQRYNGDGKQRATWCTFETSDVRSPGSSSVAADSLH
jgi:hypothetical protein